MLFPYAESKRIRLRPATVADGPRIYDVLFELGHPDLPTLDAFVRDFSGNVGPRFLIQRRDSDEVVGFTELVEMTVAGHIRAAVYTTSAPAEEIARDAAALTVNFAFAMWRVRKIYLYALDEGLAGLGFVGDYAPLVRHEAVLPDHLYQHGRLWDLHIHAIYRDQWDKLGLELLKEIV